MKVKEDRTTLVLVGAFNPSILTPQWVAKYGLAHEKGDEFKVQMMAPIGGMAPTRYSFDGFSFTPSYNNLTIHLSRSNVAECDRAVVAVANILAQLSHTPIAGVGFNFAFSTQDHSAPLAKILTVNDAVVDTFPDEPEVVTKKWGNSLTWNNSLVNIDCELAGGETTIAFNFHYSTASAKEAETVLRGEDVFMKHYSRALSAAKALAEQDLEDQ